jgi:hypothetical protein
MFSLLWVVSIHSGCHVYRLDGWSLVAGSAVIFLLANMFRPNLGFTKPILWMPGSLSLVILSSAPSSAEVKNACSFTSSPPLSLHGCCLCTGKTLPLISMKMIFYVSMGKTNVLVSRSFYTYNTIN